MKRKSKRKRTKPYGEMGQCRHNRKWGRCKLEAIREHKERNYCGNHWRSHKKIELSTMLREIALKRDKKCVRCGSYDNLHKSHIIAVSGTHQLEFEPLNVKILCYSCHLHFWHKDVIAAARWAREYFGDERIDWLEEQQISRTGDHIDLDAIERSLKAELQKLEG